tara:strand:- start:541 stop:792 length:252 start_codon:yes stop_codon:yes gene_type:complete
MDTLEALVVGLYLVVCMVTVLAAAAVLVDIQELEVEEVEELMDLHLKLVTLVQMMEQEAAAVHGVLDLEVLERLVAVAVALVY